MQIHISVGLYYILFVLIYSATVAHLLREVCLSISAVWGVPTTILVKTPKMGLS